MDIKQLEAEHLRGQDELMLNLGWAFRFKYVVMLAPSEVINLTFEIPEGVELELVKRLISSSAAPVSYTVYGDPIVDVQGTPLNKTFNRRKKLQASHPSQIVVRQGDTFIDGGVWVDEDYAYGRTDSGGPVASRGVASLSLETEQRKLNGNFNVEIANLDAVNATRFVFGLGWYERPI